MVNENKATGYHKGNTLNVLAGLLIGSLAGVILMIVLGMRPGMKMRHLVRQRGVSMHGRMVGTFNDLVKLTHYDNRQIPAGIRVQTALQPV